VLRLLWQVNEIKGMLKNYLLEKNYLIDCKHGRQKMKECRDKKSSSFFPLLQKGTARYGPEVQICH